MDQLKVVLAAIQKHHFWVLGGVVLILLLGFWWQATAGLAKQFDTRKKTLLGLRQDISNLVGTPDPPNEGVINAIVQVHHELFNNVMDAWRYLYKQQQDNNPLPEDLGADFISYWNSLKPEQTIPDQYRDTYWTFITNYLPRQRERVGVWRRKDGEEDRRAGAAGGMMAEGHGGRGGEEEVEYVGKVVWDQDNYDQFQARFHWVRRPTTEQIRLAQEDLWVCDTLLNIVRDLNAGAQSHYSAPVKRIFALEIGREATKALATAQDALEFGSALGAAGKKGGPPGSNPMDEGMMGQPMMEPGRMSEGPMPMEMAPGMMSGNLALGEGLLEGRYVDENAQPVAVKNGVAEHPYRQFKMMPIHLSLLMDQRKIPELMVKCANSNMPIKVRQLRLTPGQVPKIDYSGQTSGSTRRAVMPSGGSGYGNFPGGVEGMEMGGRQPGGGEEMMMPGAGGGRRGRGGSYQGPYDMPVEILGIIYIYNFPRREELGMGVESAEAGTEATPAATTPPSTPETTPAAKPETPPATPPATTPAAKPATTPATPPATTPAAKPGTTPAAKPGATPATPPGTAPAAPPGATPAAKPGTAPAVAPAKG